MAKYDPLRRFLRRRSRIEAVVLRFDEIERIIGAILPKAACESDWWSNVQSTDPRCAQQRAWLDAGYEACLGTAETVIFRPSRPPT